MRPCPWATRKEPEIAIAFLHVPTAGLHACMERMLAWNDGERPYVVVVLLLYRQ
jgi:hypothetical protein